MNKFLLLFLFFISFGFSQVGINTATPNASSMLDISATDKGVLFPRVSLSNINLTQLDGVNTAATGLLIWNNNATTIGGNGVGYYYFNGTVWIPVVQTFSPIIDTDNQNIDVLSLTGNILNISLQDDGLPTQTLNLSAIDNQASDVFSLTGNTLNLSLQNDGVATQTVDLSTLQDHDWYEIGGTTPATAINDNIYTIGDVVIGKTTPALAKLDVQSNAMLNTLSLTNANTSIGTKNGIENTIDMNVNNDNSNAIVNNVTGLANTKNGILNVFNTTNTTVSPTVQDIGVSNSFNTVGNVTAIGFRNTFNAQSTNLNNLFGSYNQLVDNNLRGRFYGLYNSVISDNLLGQYGVTNTFSTSGNGENIGIETFISSSGVGQKYGEKIQISSGSGGTHYGIYADVTKSNSYAGYFLGRISVGTTTTNNYILPSSRGTANQVMQTDGVGNVTWANPTGASDADWYEIGTGLPPNANNDDIYNLGRVSIGSAATPTAKLDITNHSNGTALQIEQGVTTTSTQTVVDVSCNTNNASKTGLNLSLAGTNSASASIFKGADGTVGDEHIGLDLTFNGGSTNDPFNFVKGTNITIGSSSIYSNVTGHSFMDLSNSTGNKIGIYQKITNTGNGDTYGIDNDLQMDVPLGNANSLIGVRNLLEANGAGDAIVYGTLNSIYGISTTNNNKYGSYNSILSTLGGTHYGVYSDVLKTGSYAGYFLGRMSIGTTTTNNYILPASRGTNGQTMQTDALGNVSWVNAAGNQIIDVLSMSGNTLSISLSGDGLPNQTVDLSSADNQTIDLLGLTGNFLSLSLQNDGLPNQVLDLSPALHWSDQTTHIQPSTLGKSVIIGDNITAPTAKLSVKTDSAPATPQLEIIENQVNDDAKIKFSNAFETVNDWSIYARSDDTSINNLFNINHTIGGNIVRINGEGRVGIMRTAATNELEVGGNASKTTAGAWLANSDSRLKKKISTISPTDALKKVLSLRGVNYEWNDDKTGTKRPEGNQIGFVAQEIQEVFPEKVTEDKLGYLQTAYGDYDPIIFQAIKALNDKIEKLEKENIELKQLVVKQK